VVAGLFGTVVCSTWLVQGQQRLDEMSRTVAEEQARYELLRLEVARLEAPERIVAEAARLGMVPPPLTTYLVPPAPAPAVDDAGVATAEDSRDSSDSEALGGVGASSWEEVKPYLGASP
jgi:hypothetical protein